MGIQELMDVPPAQRDLDWIKDSLWNAVRLEFATIPPYLTALWSVRQPNDVADVIRGVAMDEMLHMGFALNLLVAVGGVPRLTEPGFVPDYPCALPGHVHPGLTVGLERLSQKLVKDVFMGIELPEHTPIVVLESLQPEEFPTIGKFYDAIRDAFHHVGPSFDASHQLEESDHFDPPLTRVTKLDDVDPVIKLIKEQGEGTAQSAFAEDYGGTLAHYYLFQQLVDEKTIVKGPDGKAHFGAPLPFPKEAEIYPMAPVPQGGYPGVSDEFDKQFTLMLKQLQATWTEEPATAGQQFTNSVKSMRKLRKLAQALMEKPLPSGTGTYGPSFRLILT